MITRGFIEKALVKSDLPCTVEPVLPATEVEVWADHQVVGHAGQYRQPMTHLFSPCADGQATSHRVPDWTVVNHGAIYT